MLEENPSIYKYLHNTSYKIPGKVRQISTCGMKFRKKIPKEKGQQIEIWCT